LGAGVQSASQNLISALKILSQELDDEEESVANLRQLNRIHAVENGGQAKHSGAKLGKGQALQLGATFWFVR